MSYYVSAFSWLLWLKKLGASLWSLWCDPKSWQLPIVCLWHDCCWLEMPKLSGTSWHSLWWALKSNLFACPMPYALSFGEATGGMFVAFFAARPSFLPGKKLLSPHFPQKDFWTLSAGLHPKHLLYREAVSYTTLFPLWYAVEKLQMWVVWLKPLPAGLLWSCCWLSSESLWSAGVGMLLWHHGGGRLASFPCDWMHCFHLQYI